MQRLSLQAKLRTMKLLLTSAGLLATLLQAGCGSNGSGDAAAAADPDAALKEAACACLQEMDAVVADLIATGQKENWEARRWNEELGARTVPCAVRKESHEETLKWIEFQQACEAYPAYSEKLAVVSQKLQEFRSSETEPVQNMGEVTGGGGAKELLDQLAGKSGGNGKSGSGQ